jgi:hypothetical protein
MEFQLFVYPAAYEYEHSPIASLEADLVWPASWNLVNGAFCNDGWGSLEGHHLSVEWPCPVITGQLFLAATLVFEADVAGQLGFQYPGQNPVWLGCHPSGFFVDAVGIFAEVGTTCEYNRYDCAYISGCTPGAFSPTELRLTAPSGGNAQGEARFHSLSPTGDWCNFGTNIGAPWATASVATGPGYAEYTLTVTADASGLEPGPYQTWVQVHWGQVVARCIGLTFDVQENTGLSGPPVRGRLATWGRIKMTYRE